MDRIIQWLEGHQLPCFYKKFLGIECLGCGMQTAFIHLLKGEFRESINTYPALMPVLFTLSFLVLHLIFRFGKGALILKISATFTLTLMVIHYIFNFNFI